MLGHWLCVRHLLNNMIYIPCMNVMNTILLRIIMSCHFFNKDDLVIFSEYSNLPERNKNYSLVHCTLFQVNIKNIILCTLLISKFSYPMLMKIGIICNKNHSFSSILLQSWLRLNQLDVFIFTKHFLCEDN